jgi:hypothetical protein
MLCNKLKNNTLCLASSLVIAGIVMLSAAFAFASEVVRLENGIEVNLYTAQTILEQLTERDPDGRLYLRLPGELLRYRLVEDINDDIIINKGDGSFHPFNLDAVVQALAAVDLGGVFPDYDIDVYILPYPRYYLLSSTSSGNRIFLSPGVYEASQYAVAYTATHELGHTFQHYYLPDEDLEGWKQYLTLRGIYGDPDYSSTAEHMNRPKEIFAEDFRFLFGGEYATYSGTIENSELVLPSLIPALEPLMASLVTGEFAIDYNDESMPAGEPMTVSNYPNPFNPVTTIDVTFDGSASSEPHYIDVKIYGVDGRLVKSLYSGPVARDRFSIGWNATDDRGIPVASGVYFYRVRADVGNRVGKMLLMR